MEPADSLVPWALLAGGLLYLLCGLPLWLQRVPTNSVVGFRTQATLDNPALWYRVNRALGQDMVVAGVVISVAAGLGARQGSLDLNQLRWVFGTYLLATLAMILRSALLVIKATRRSA